ncbi:chemotaxis protein CheA [Sideroxydans lithotrophicus]|uniref:Chemotaxis protein CheA n=1 Tax=Sideroxydans lithotrophicus (strain ES-1) TaxID=580332 RepID=D5CS85_SIDLE|nr:chemotaxis protein CheA [Sideroxydans lithotrophicus]ADE11821.1 CheA signal transduction histidine kinase [Sideroxydans lithotrophicus ES-1]
MNLDEALKTFIIESRELLEQMEDALLRIEQAEHDPEIINAIFRAAHTIKGSAGLFGLEYIVAFTHVAESVLDKVRSGELTIEADLVALLLSARDHIGALVDHAAQGQEPDEDSHRHSAELVKQLNLYLGHKAEEATLKNAVPAAQSPQIERAIGDGVETDNWHISLRFGVNVLRNGMDPLSFIRYLNTFGKVINVVTIVESIPPISQLDPESCHLGFEISYQTDADKTAIEGAFEFVRDDCQIRIMPPHSKMIEYINLIRDLPEKEMRLGEILVQCGTLTESELEQTLRNQAQCADDHKRPLGETLLEEKVVRPAVVSAALEKQKQVKEQKTAESNLIRVDADKLDHLINLIGELTIASAGTVLVAQRAGISELQEAASTMSRLVEEVRDSALTLRMVQIGATFNRFQRVVRDVSKELGKEIELIISGAETELDKTVVEKIGDPLTHLVRNSMDHGIESAEVRIAAGKPAKGTLRLNAYHDSGSIVIEVSDDGGGLKKDKILGKAIERGLVQPDANLSDKEIFNLIFEAGFSTADVVSNLSGRGVGMDVVRRNITALRGSIDLSSEEGKGTTIRIRLPLTLAIIDGFLVGVGKSSFVIPLDLVVECIELSEADKRAAKERNYLSLRGQVLPYLRLRDLFDVTGAPVRRENVVVVQYGESRAGLVVDTLQGEFQTVIKPLGRIFNHLNGIGGSTILGSGEVALILDVPRLVQQVSVQTEKTGTEVV